MPATLADMTPDEFRRLLETTVEHKLREVLGLADDGPLDDALTARLVEQRAAVAAGDRGISLTDALGELGAG